jgi:hypothetical protein
MKTWRSGGIAPPLLTSVLEGGDWSASGSCRFIPGNHRLYGLQNRSGHYAEEKNLVLPGIEPSRPARSPSAYRLIYSDSKSKLESLRETSGSWWPENEYYWQVCYNPTYNISKYLREHGALNWPVSPSRRKQISTSSATELHSHSPRYVLAKFHSLR